MLESHIAVLRTEGVIITQVNIGGTEIIDISYPTEEESTLDDE